MSWGLTDLTSCKDKGRKGEGVEDVAHIYKPSGRVDHANVGVDVLSPWFSLTTVRLFSLRLDASGSCQGANGELVGSHSALSERVTLLRSTSTLISVINNNVTIVLLTVSGVSIPPRVSRRPSESMDL